MRNTVVIRRDEPQDKDGIRVLHERAFGRADEAALVDAVRGVTDAISLVAAIDDRVVGHILFTPVQILDSASGQGRTGVRPGSDPVAKTAMPAMGLAPMAVLPEHQRRGIGSELVRAGLDACRAAGHTIVVVLGHPAFYSRFGFVPALTRGIAYEHPVPSDAFMVCELNADALRGVHGIVKYRPEFASV